MMVKMQAVQSALAVRRQRSRREEVRKAKQRRESSVSVLSPRPSLVSLDGRVYFDEKKESKSALGHVTMFHVGGVLILIGLMLVTTSLMPSYVNSTTPQRRSDLLGTGSFFVFLGGVLTTISRFMSNNEDRELNQYIQGRLARSRSGHRLKDPEAAFPTPSKERRVVPTENGVVPSHSAGVSEPEIHSDANGHLLNHNNDVEAHNAPTSTAFEEGQDIDALGGLEDPISLSVSTEPVLSRILEEDEIEIDTDPATEPIDSTPESSLTPTSSLETQGLLDKYHAPRSISKTSVKSACKSVKVTT